MDARQISFRVMGCWLGLLATVAMALPAAATEAGDMRSILLVAKKGLPDPLFGDSVVLVTHRGGRSPVGLILNKPSEIRLSRAAPEFEESAAGKRFVFQGGPVQAQSLVILFRGEVKDKEGSLEVFPGIFMSSNPEVLREVLGRKTLPANLRIFAGHAAWFPGQLEAEVARGDWHLAKVDAAAIFDDKPREQWRKFEHRATTKLLRAPPTSLPLPLPVPCGHVLQPCFPATSGSAPGSCRRTSAS